VADDIKSALADMGFDRVFLDFDKDNGIGVGEEWEKCWSNADATSARPSGCCASSWRGRSSHLM
jgi:hypothetical protein